MKLSLAKDILKIIMWSNSECPQFSFYDNEVKYESSLSVTSGTLSFLSDNKSNGTSFAATKTGKMLRVPVAAYCQNSPL